VVRLFASPEEEERLYRELEFRGSERERAYLTPRMLTGLEGIGQNYWWLHPEASLRLAQAGHTAASPTVKAAGRAGARVRTRKRGWAQIGQFLKAEVRGALTALRTPLEEVQGVFRAMTVAEEQAAMTPGGGFLEAPRRTLELLPKEFGKSVGAIALRRLLRGEGAGLGTGLLPRGEAVEEHERRVRELRLSTLPGDKPVSIGRAAAVAITEPGTKPFNVLSGLVDASLALGADPAYGALSGASKLRAASKVFESAGGVSAARKTIIPRTVEGWLDSPSGRQVIDHLTEEKNFDAAWRRLSKKVPVETVVKLVDADDPVQVRGILHEALGITIREKPRLARFPEVRRHLNSVRLLQQMPGRHIDLDDADRAVETLDRVMKNVKMPADLIAENTEAMARATSKAERFQVLKGTLENVADELGLRRGTDLNLARRLTRIWDNYNQEMAHYFIDEIGENAHIPGVAVDGIGRALPEPHLFVEYIQRAVPLPDAREIRRVASAFRNVWENPAVKFTTSFLDAVHQQLWKPAQLLRGAWTVRVVGEEQLRMAASGFDSLLSHPLSAVAWITGRRGGKGLTGVPFKAASEAASDLDDFGRAMSRGTMGFRDPAIVMAKNKVLVQKGSEHFASSWADELIQLRTDPIAQRVAGGLREGDRVATTFARESLDAVKDWFFDGAGKGLRQELADASGKAGFLTREGADAYLDSVHRRIQIKTGGDSRLVDAIASGLLEGKPIRASGDIPSVTKGFVRQLESLAKEGIGPEVVKGDQVLIRKPKEALAGYDRAVETMFGALMSKPTNALSRSPAFRQFYWRRAAELVPFMDEAAQTATLKAANDSNLTRSAIDRIGRAASRGKGTLTMNEADTVAKAFALDSTKRLLYDLTEKSQLFDITRHIFPFGEAWREVLTRWLKIGMQRPQTIRRAQQLVEGAEGSGFFYVDEQTGEEMFAYPGGEFLTKALLDTPVRLTGTLKSLNILGNVVPGFGPLVQIPAGWFLPDKPEWDGIKEILLPYGELKTEGGIVESLLPAYMQKFRQAIGKPADERLFNNTVMNVAGYLLTTGEYSTDTPEEISRLMNEAKARAKGLYILRGIAQSILPAAPRPEFLAHDKEGRLMLAEAMAQDYRKMLDEDPNTAAEQFLKKYGEGAFFLTQPKSMALVDAPINKEGLDWIRKNGGLQKKYPLTLGLFAPQGEDFDYQAYLRQFEKGERVALTAEQWVQRTNHRLATLIYRAAQQRVSDSPDEDEQEWLRQIREALKVELPGYQDFTGLAERAKPEVLIRELTRAAKDPQLSQTDAGRGLTLYLQARDRALASAKDDGLVGFGTAKGARYIRDWLRQVGTAAVQEYPDFEPLWSRVFSRELPQEEEEAA
jgi:hypothetical protein